MLNDSDPFGVEQNITHTSINPRGVKTITHNYNNQDLSPLGKNLHSYICLREKKNERPLDLSTLDMFRTINKPLMTAFYEITL